MSKQASAAAIVARYLKANNYAQTLNAFIEEAGLSQDAGDTNGGDLTLETLLDEKNKFDISLRFEKLGVNDDQRGWSRPAPSTAEVVKSLPSTSNILYACASRLVDEDGWVFAPGAVSIHSGSKIAFAQSIPHKDAGTLDLVLSRLADFESY